MHPRVSLHQFPFIGESTSAFIGHCRAAGIPGATLITSKVMEAGGLEETQRALAAGGTRCTSLNHLFAAFPNLDEDGGEAAKQLLQAIDAAASLGADNVYMLTGGRGSLSWEDAADRFSALIAPCVAAARDKNVRLLVETSTAYYADINIAHTLDDTIALADVAGIELCVELHACWFEGGLKEKFARAIPKTGLVQVSDYVPGDRGPPCRAVPGDGMVPLARLIGDILDAGYTGFFDLELVGPRIVAEGIRPATQRAAERLSEILAKLGA
jgi:sugar phosphate isomerase/epimerase